MTASFANTQLCTLHWISSPLFEWQRRIEELSWIPTEICVQVKANFARFATNVIVECRRGDGSAPGFGGEIIIAKVIVKK